MSKSSKLGSAGRFGVRYGQSVKKRISEIESRQKKKQICPFCGGRAKRISKGIWVCGKCGKKFSGHAYYLENQSNSSDEQQPQVMGKKEKAKVLKMENTEQIKSDIKPKSKKSKVKES